MDAISSGLKSAFHLLAGFDPEIYGTLGFTAAVASVSTFISAAVGVPLGFLVGYLTFPGKRLAVVCLNTLMSLPTVVAGLLVYLLICRQGPFGPLGMIFTPAAIVIGEVVLTTPIIAAMTLAAVQCADPRICLTARTLGAGQARTTRTLLFEVRFAVLASVIAGFGRAVSEVGAAMMLGGNIKGYTRTLTTAIALDTGKGEFDSAMALGVILLMLAVCFNVCLQVAQGKARKVA